MILDINLIPKKKNKVSGAALLLRILLGLVFMAVLGYFGIFIPVQEKGKLIKEIKLKEKQLEELNNSNDLYLTENSLVEVLTKRVEMYNSLKLNRNLLTKTFRELEEAQPVNITILNLSIVEGVLLLDGYSPTYKEIAQYVVKLREVSNVQQVTFQSAKKEIGENLKELHYFNIQVQFANNGVSLNESTMDENMTDQDGGQ